MKPPSTAWPTTPSGSSTPSIARSRRNGRRRHASAPAATAASPTSPEISRLPYSIHACVSSGGTAPPKHFGQSGQPRPEPVSRTAAPVKTISVSAARATSVTRWYCRGVSSGRRTLRRLASERGLGLAPPLLRARVHELGGAVGLGALRRRGAAPG